MRYNPTTHAVICMIISVHYFFHLWCWNHYFCYTVPAQVTYTPTVQYLPNRLSGVVRCYSKLKRRLHILMLWSWAYIHIFNLFATVQANPGIQFVMWTRDKHLLEPYETEGFAVMHNGSLLIERVKESHQGMYTCTPYNVHGTKGASLAMQVIVKDPPKFEITPDPMYQSKLGTSLEIPCSAVAPNGTTSPLITWQRVREKGVIKFFTLVYVRV